MRVPFFQIDAFTSQLFAGNPAAVMVMEAFPADELLQGIAAENNLAETAFLVPHEGNYRLRWFTPKVEVALCGHATLASAAVVMERLEVGRAEVIFQTASGPLTVSRTGGGYALNFPSRPAHAAVAPAHLTEALGASPTEVLATAFTYTAVLETAEQVRHLEPDLAAVASLDRNGLIVTAPGDGPYDFVSRYFAPAKGVPEDPVTGSAHCTLVPYWAGRLGRSEFRAFQASRRGGEIHCRLLGDRVELGGACVFFLEGEARL